MKILSSVIFIFAALATAAAPQASSTVTVLAWPLSAASPTPFATIALLSSAKTISAKVQSVQQPSLPSDELVRIGILDDSNNWTGVATSAKSFASQISKKIVLYTDTEGRVSHIGFNAFETSAGENEAVIVEVIPIQPGPQPTLNKPVVLNAEGRVAAPETADTKSFLAKYWWAIALFLVVQVVAGGTKEE